MVAANRPKMLVATTNPVTAWTIMRGQLRFLESEGYDVLFVSAPGDLLDATGEREGVRTVPVAMERPISIRADVRALKRLFHVFRAEHPEISMVSTPKAGLLGGIAAWATRVPTRIYVLRGLRLETAHGVQRVLLWLLEWLALHLAHSVIVVSPSLLARTRQLHLLNIRRGVVLGAGASNGVDSARFAPTPERRMAARAIRATFGIPSDAFVFGYVGRLAPDKGVRELASAFASLAAVREDVWLLMVGPQDSAGLSRGPAASIESIPRVVFTGWLPEPADVYGVLDALVLPTHREGFPNVSIEAAAARLPVITTSATGAIDSIRPGVTGMLVPPRDPSALLAAMSALAGDRERAVRMGVRGQEFVAAEFTNATVWNHLAKHLDTVRGNRSW